MPATEVSPSLRRRLSDDARQLLRQAFQSNGEDLGAVLPSSPAASVRLNNASRSLKRMPLADRLQRFRGQVRLEIPEINCSGLCLRIVVTGTGSYLLRYSLDRIGAELSVFNKSSGGSLTCWVALHDGRHVQLRSFMATASCSPEECQQIKTLIEMLESLDLGDIVRGCASAQPVSPVSTLHGAAVEGLRAISSSLNVYLARSVKNSYVLVFDQTTGLPLKVTQSSIDPSQGPQIQSLDLFVDEYVRYENSSIDIPQGIKSDVDLMIDAAMTCFSQWSYDAQQQVMMIFDAIDKDSDGFISSSDVYQQLLTVEHAPTHAANVVLEMSRILCDAADPTEEFGFYKFCGFWITLLSDHYHVTDPANETAVLSAVHRLFLGA